jgi:hypothetical protein
VFLGSLCQLIGPVPASGASGDQEISGHEVGVGLTILFVIVTQGRISTVYFVARRPGETNAPVPQFLEFPTGDLRCGLERDIIGNTGFRTPSLPGGSSTGEPVFFRKEQAVGDPGRGLGCEVAEEH